MLQITKNLRLDSLLLQTCLLLILWNCVSCQNSFDGGRKVLRLTASSKSQSNVEQIFNLSSSVCRIVHQERDLTYCFGALVSSRWLLTATSCAPADKRPADNHVQVVCGSPNNLTTHNRNEFDVVEVQPLRSAITGERQESGIALLKLGTDAPGPYVRFEESDRSDFYILEQKEVMDTFFKGPGLREGSTHDTWRNANIELIGLPFIKKPSSLRNRDRSENALHQITTCCLATSCKLFSDGVKRCVFNRITPREHKSLCLATGTCNEMPSSSSVTPSFHLSLSASIKEKACLDSPRPIPLAERRLIPPFAPRSFCSNDKKAKLQSLSREQMMSTLKRLVKNDDATGVNNTLTCSEFNIDARDNHNETFLHDAAWHNSSRSAQVLCELGINSEVKNKQGKTALLVAAYRTSLEALEVILNFSANVNAVDNRGKTALYYAVKNCDTNMTEFLLKNEVDPLIKDDKGKKPHDLISNLSDSCDNTTVQHLDSLLEKAETKQK